MTEKEALDRLNSINLSREQKIAIIDVIKGIINTNISTYISIIGTINNDFHKQDGPHTYTYKATITPINNTFKPEHGKLYKVNGINHGCIIFYFSNYDYDDGEKLFESNIIVLTESQGEIFNCNFSSPYICRISYKLNDNNTVEYFDAEINPLNNE